MKAISVRGKMLTDFPEICQEYMSKNDKKVEEVQAGMKYRAFWKCKKCNKEYEKAVIERTSLNHGCKSCVLQPKKLETLLRHQAMTSKECTKCKKTKPIEEFHFEKKGCRRKSKCSNCCEQRAKRI